jgi:hypothetical protein
MDITVLVRDDDESGPVAAHPLLGDYMETTGPSEPLLEEPGGGFGQGLGLSDDAATFVSLPSNFWYYGLEFAGMNVCSNGFIDFDDSHIEYWLSGIPQGGAFDNTLYPMWTDLNPYYRGDVYTMTVDDPDNPGNDAFVVTWDNVPHYYGTGNYDFQVVLRYADFTIEFRYQQVNPVFSYTHTIGIEGPDTSWYVSSHTGSYPPGYMTRMYEATEWAPAMPAIPGTGEATRELVVRNQLPTVAGDLTTRVALEDQPVTISGLEITDAALTERTEWFAYRVTGDWPGATSDWIYMGSLAPPKMKVLLVHSLEGDVGNMEDQLASLEIVEQVDLYNIFERAPICQAPSLALMLEYDAIVWGSNWGWYSWFAPDWWDAREDFGDRLATYQDLTAADGSFGGVMTYMAAYDQGGEFGNMWMILGRYMNEDYGAFESRGYSFGTATLGDTYPAAFGYEPVMNGEGGFVDELGSSPIYSGDYNLVDPTARPGGGQVGLLGDWQNGASAIGASELASGARSVNIGQFAGYNFAGDMNELQTNALLWTSHEFIPQPDIPAFDVTIKDNGVYTLDVQAIDDDMGWLWDPIANEPVPAVLPAEYAGYEPEISHNYLPIEVLNVDPTIHDVQAFVTGDLCLRLSGNKGNKATLEIFDGTATTLVELVRSPGNPEFACAEDVTINMLRSAGSYVKVIYEPGDDDGANPSWIVEGYWPGDEPHKVKFTFDSKGGYQEAYVSFGDLFANVPINFRVIASDPGTDDLAVVFNWGDAMPHGVHLYSNVLAGSSFVVGFTEETSTMFDQLSDRDPWFDRTCVTPPGDPTANPCIENDERSPDGNDMAIDDTQTHAFSTHGYYFVMMTVMNDDVGDGYPSDSLTDGTDTEFVEIDLS